MRALAAGKGRQVIGLWILGALVAGAIIAIGANMIGRYSGVTVPREDSNAIASLLEPHLREVRPEGDGPFPTALLFSGCDGVRDNMTTWAEVLKSEGWASLIVDSHAPRGYDELQIWRLICAGQLFSGPERAGDVAVAMELARQRSFVDPDRLALIGASHGGWAVLEFLSAADHGQVPLTLNAWPPSLDPEPLGGVGAVVLLYPYCGQISRAARRGWRTPVPTLFLLAENDTITDERECLKLAERETRRGLPVETEVLTGVTHGFDQQDKAPLSILDYDSDATEAAIARVKSFLTNAFQ